MAYATQNDIIEIYGADALYVADRDGDGVIDSDAVARALQSASDEIDTHLTVRYPLPFVNPPPILKQYCIDIAIYRLALSRAVLSEEHRTRYEDAIAALKRIAEGKAALVIPVDPDAEPGDETGPDLSGPKPIVQDGPPRLFTREETRGL